MAVVIKSKNLDWFLDKGIAPATVAQLKGLGATIEKPKDNFGFTLHIGSKSWVLKSPVLLAKQEVAHFLNTVFTDLKAMAQAAPAPGQAAQPVPMVIPLRDAKAMYQRVTGTSNGSVYVVVAISKSAKIQIAAKVEGAGSLSVRVEGEGLVAGSNTVKTLNDHALKLKASNAGASYMSGHYQCTSEAPAAKVLGSILLGTGFAFETPMPDMVKVIEGGV